MKALLVALLSLLRTILFGWIVALIHLVGRFLALVRAALDRSRLEGRQAKGADSNCVPIRHPSYRRPDPLIYSQSYIMSLGLAVTWDNPDIELQRGGVPVPSSEIEPDTDYEIVARIWNGSTNAPIVGLPVDFSYLDFGIGAASIVIGSTAIDLGVKGGSRCPAFATIPWRTPSTPGHYCVQVRVSWIDDANPLNNVGQENLTVGRAESPAEFTFILRNEDRQGHVFDFEVDAYELPDSVPCEAIERPSKRELHRRSVEPATSRLFPRVPDGVRARHDRSAHPVPDGWAVRFEPAEVSLDAGADRLIRVSVEPPTGFLGARRLNVRAVDGEHVAGGVTLVVEQS